MRKKEEQIIFRCMKTAQLFFIIILQQCVLIYAIIWSRRQRELKGMWRTTVENTITQQFRYRIFIIWVNRSVCVRIKCLSVHTPHCVHLQCKWLCFFFCILPLLNNSCLMVLPISFYCINFECRMYCAAYRAVNQTTHSYTKCKFQFKIIETKRS